MTTATSTCSQAIHTDCNPETCNVKRATLSNARAYAIAMGCREVTATHEKVTDNGERVVICQATWTRTS